MDLMQVFIIQAKLLLMVMLHKKASLHLKFLLVRHTLEVIEQSSLHHNSLMQTNLETLIADRMLSLTST
jgi:hypothetical protein